MYIAHARFVASCLLEANPSKSYASHQMAPKNVPTFSLKKSTSDQPLQNCFGVWLGLDDDCLLLIHTEKKTKVDQNLSENSLLPECCRLYPDSDCVDAIQCSVTTRKSNATVSILENRRGFIAADNWPSHSPYLNPLDYCI